MGKPKTVITENGAVYQLSDPSALRLVYRIVGVALILMGAVLTLISPAGVAFAALGVALVFWLAQKDPASKEISSLHRYAMRRELHVWALGSQSTHRAGAT